MTSLSFPVPLDDKMRNLIKNLSDNGIDNNILSSIENVFDYGVRQGVQNTFLYNYITKNGILDIAKSKRQHNDISSDDYAKLYAMSENEMFKILSCSDTDWSVYQQRLETNTLVDLGDICDDATYCAVDILIDHIDE